MRFRKIQHTTSMQMLVLLLIAALILSSCANKAAESEGAKNQLTKLSIMVPLHQPKPPPENLMENLKAKTGLDLDIQWVPDDIYSNKLMNALETNTLRQVTFVKSVDLNLVKSAIRSDMFWNIGSYLDYYPNLKKLSKTVLDQTAVDGKYYGLYNERPESRQGVLIRKDWLDRLGLSEPRSLDELYEVMKAFTNRDPDGNGKADTIGLADRSDLIYGAFKTLSSYFGTPNNWAQNGDTFVPEFDTPEYMSTMNYMRKLYNENIINKDFPVTSKSVQRYMMTTGKAGVYIGSLADAPRMQEEMRGINPSAQLTVVNRIQGPKGYGVWSIPGFNGIFLFSKKNIKTEEDLKQVLAFFDRTMDKDVSNLLMYGIENTHYLLKDGKVVVSEEMYERQNLEVPQLLALMIANNSNHNLYPRSEEQMDPLLLKANRLIADNSSMVIRDPTIGLTSITYDERITELTSIINNATYNYILGKIDAAGFKAEVETWRSKGGNVVISELQEAYRKSKAK